MNPIDWNNLFKIRVANPDDSFQKHEVIKLMLVMKILKKYKKRNFIRIYTEFKLENGNKADVYFEDIKNKAVYIYEVQKKFTKEWLERKTKEYNNYELAYFTVNFIPINLNELSWNIKELNEELDKYVF